MSSRSGAVRWTISAEKARDEYWALAKGWRMGIMLCWNVEREWGEREEGL